MNKQIFDSVKVSIDNFKGSALREKISLEKENITKKYPEVSIASIMEQLDFEGNIVLSFKRLMTRDERLAQAKRKKEIEKDVDDFFKTIKIAEI